MDSTKMKLWLYLLENTKLPQVIGELGTPSNGMCCMGVANSFLFHQSDAPYYEFMSAEANWQLELDNPIEYSEALKMKRITGIRINGKLRRHVLGNLNDVHGYSFAQIADFIRKMGWDECK